MVLNFISDVLSSHKIHESQTSNHLNLLNDSIYSQASCSI